METRTFTDPDGDKLLIEISGAIQGAYRGGCFVQISAKKNKKDQDAQAMTVFFKPEQLREIGRAFMGAAYYLDLETPTEQVTEQVTK